MPFHNLLADEKTSKNRERLMTNKSMLYGHSFVQLYWYRDFRCEKTNDKDIRNQDEDEISKVRDCIGRLHVQQIKAVVSTTKIDRSLFLSNGRGEWLFWETLGQTSRSNRHPTSQ
jgi:hypothetical protein